MWKQEPLPSRDGRVVLEAALPGEYTLDLLAGDLHAPRGATVLGSDTFALAPGTSVLRTLHVATK